MTKIDRPSHFSWLGRIYSRSTAKLLVTNYLINPAASTTASVVTFTILLTVADGVSM